MVAPPRPIPEGLAQAEQVSFNMLRVFLNPAPPPPRRAKPYTPPPTPKTSPVDDSKPLKFRSQLEERIEVGIERVLTEAWEAVPEDTAAEERFKAARQNAEQSISRLSPHIKRQVRAHFNQENWESLMAREPKL